MNFNIIHFAAIITFFVIIWAAIVRFLHHRKRLDFKPNYYELKLATDYMEKAQGNKHKAIWLVNEDLREHRRTIKENPKDDNLKRGLNTLKGAKCTIIRELY